MCQLLPATVKGRGEGTVCGFCGFHGSRTLLGDSWHYCLLAKDARFKSGYQELNSATPG